jgi:hypothetical protein
MTTEKLIWPRPIDVLGVTGRYSSGKSVFITTICRPDRCRAYDLEKSLSSYGDLVGMGMDIIDVSDELRAKYGEAGYTQKQLFMWWLNDIKQLPGGRYQVIAVDPADELEAGLVDFVKGNHSAYGFKDPEAFYRTGGIFWNEVRKEWKRILVDLASRCQTFAFSTHLKKVWRHGRPTEELTPKGKSTLMELASLYLFMERDVLGTGENRDFAQKPSAIVLKSRLGHQVWSEETQEMITTPLLPPRLPVATPNAIRDYLLNPPSYANLKEEEKTSEKELTQDARLELQVMITENQRMAAEANREAALVESQKEESRRLARARLQPAPDQTTTVQAQQDAQADERQGSPDGMEAEATEPVTKEEVKAMLADATAKGVDAQVRASLRKNLGVERVTIGAVRKLPRERFNKLVAWIDSK